MKYSVPVLILSLTFIFNPLTTAGAAELVQDRQYTATSRTTKNADRCPLAPKKTVSRPTKDYSLRCIQAARLRRLPVSASNAKARYTRNIPRLTRTNRLTISPRHTLISNRMSARSIRSAARLRNAQRRK